jgi:homoserine kinase type II
MAVYTELLDEELEALLEAFALSPALAFKGIAEGVENSNFFLETREGRFILTIFEKRVVDSDLPFFMALLETLAEAGFPSARPRRTAEGGLIARVRGKPCAIVAFLPGTSPRRPSPPQCRAIGSALARLHEGLAGFAATRTNALGVAAWGAMLRPRMEAIDALFPGLAEEVAADLAAVEAAWPATLPRGIIHADLFPDNALFLGDAVSGVIDFYFACEDALAYDLAVCLNAWCFEPDRSFNLTKGMALVAGYQAVRRLSDEERAALPILARGAALRFFATRLVDWGLPSSGPMVRKKDPLEYVDRLAFHRRARGPGDYCG